jgi:hypothetical protein
VEKADSLMQHRNADWITNPTMAQKFVQLLPKKMRHGAQIFGVFFGIGVIVQAWLHAGDKLVVFMSALR